jgi:TRAP-type C4-dicarboxylate transport system permease small subunit
MGWGKRNVVKFIAGFDRVFHRLNMVLFYTAAVFLGALVFMVGADIVLRGLFNSPLGWVKEISEYIILALPFLLASWIMETEGHIKMDLLIDKLSPRAQSGVNAITYTVGAIVLLVLSSFSLRVTLEFYRTHHFTATLLKLPKCIFTAIIFLGFAMLFIQLIRKIIGFIDTWKKVGKQKTNTRSVGD